jgi:hypothetical protein
MNYYLIYPVHMPSISGFEYKVTSTNIEFLCIPSETYKRFSSQKLLSPIDET